LFSSGPEAVAGVVNTLFALIQQRHVDKEARDALENVARTLRSDLQVSNSERRRLEQRMAEKLTELGNLELKLRSAERAASEGAGAASGRQRQLSDSKALVATLTEEKAALTGKLEELQHDFRRLVARCESMGLGLAPTDAASLQPHAVTTSSIEGVGSMAGGSAWWASAASGPRPELDEGELQHYMQTELKVVQDRCRQLMRGSSAKASCGAGDSVAELDPAQEVTQLQKVLKDQDLPR
ncbi:hypothetical protein HaLaN_15546, partial [Haematococcus lacustris]